jgi:hypothetical protein
MIPLTTVFISINPSRPERTLNRAREGRREKKEGEMACLILFADWFSLASLLLWVRD